MARPLRIEYPGAWYHVTARGNEKKTIFRQEGDRRHFLDLIEESVHRHRLLTHSYALMDNHYHLIVKELGGESRGHGLSQRRHG